MPFRESSPMEERIALFREYETGAFSVTELCARHGVSRETFYVWKRRRENGEPHWFEERSHATKSCPHATGGPLAQDIIAIRRRFPHFGPKKVKAWLEQAQPELDWPAASTIGDILKREGLVEPRPASSSSDRAGRDDVAAQHERGMGDRLQRLVPHP